MRVLTLASAIFAALLASNSAARCLSHSFEVWPPSRATVPTNFRIVISMSGTAQTLADSLSVRKPRLVAKGHTVSLSLVEVSHGAVNVAQVVLRPKDELRPDTVYMLKLDNRSHPKPNEPDLPVLSWRTGRAIDGEAPRWSTAPKTLESQYHEYGCGPESQVEVEIGVADANDVLIQAEVRNPANGSVQRFLVRPKDGRLLVGHGMCTGPFQLDREASYQVGLTAVDTSGNTAAAPGEPLNILGP